jgi:NAD(P)H dehydrogenase (quinone)
MTIAVFGATGQLGRLTLQALLDRGVPADEIRALGRDQGRLDELAAQGFATYAIDLNDPTTLQIPLKGVDEVLLISGSEVGRRVLQHKAAIEAAAAAGVRRVVYTSAPKATTTTLVLAPEHKVTEELLAESGLATTILRNGWYTENYVQDFERARATGTIANSVGSGRIAGAARADYAEAAAVVLTTDAHDGAVYELSGDVAWSFDDFAATASRVLGTEVTYQEITPEQQREGLTAAGVPAEFVEMLIALDANAREGLLAETNGDLSRLIDRPTTPLEDTLRSWA